MSDPTKPEPMTETEALYRARRSQSSNEGAQWVIASALLGIRRSLDDAQKAMHQSSKIVWVQDGPQEAAETGSLSEDRLGTMVWHTTEEDGGPDVGISISMGDGQDIWIGEIPDDLWNELDNEQKAQTGGSNSGWWLVGQNRVPLAHFVDPISGQEFADTIMVLLSRVREDATTTTTDAEPPE